MTGDAALVLRARGGDELAFQLLARRYRGLVSAQVGKYFASGGLDRADLKQEAMFGLFKAVRDFRPGHDSGFANFATVCIQRQVITAIKTAGRGKHGPLNSATSLARPIGHEDGVTLEETLPDRTSDPAARVAAREAIGSLGRLMRERLNERECAVLIRHASGYDYAEISQQLGIAVKAVDGALTRARWKLNGEGPPSLAKAGTARPRGVRGYTCPTCGGATIKRNQRGRPPRCVVCRVSSPTFRLGAVA